MLFSYETYRINIQKTLIEIYKNKKGYGKLKKLLFDCCKHNYLPADLAKIKANTKIGKIQLITIAETFCNFKLVTQKTIKTRGWTDKLIKQYLWVDIYAKNPYYKTSGDMKLYCLSRVQNLECFNPEIKNAIAATKLKRQKSKDKNKQRLIDASFKWLDAIGDPYIAIALLLRLLNQAIKSCRNYDEKQAFYDTKDRVLNKLKPYLVESCIARKENSFQNRILYFHWFNVNGYKLSFHSYQSLGYEGSCNLKQYNIKFGSKLNIDDQKLLYKLSGWRNIKEATQGLIWLCDRELLGAHKPTDNIQLFTPPKHPEPPTKDYLFALSLEKESVAMWNAFIATKHKLDLYKQEGCPWRYSCSLMGAVNRLRCINFDNCRKSYWNI